jgi:hypothetical protein
MASPMSGGNPAPYDYNSPDFSQVKPFQISGGLQSYVDLRMKEAQVDAIEQRTRLVQQQQANAAVDNAIKLSTSLTKRKEAENSSRYYFNRSWKMHDDRRKSEFQADQLRELSVYAEDIAKEKMEQTRLDTTIKSHQASLTKEQFYAAQIKNGWERKGMSPNTPYNVKMAYQQLRSYDLTEGETATILLLAGTTAEALKYIIPSGILGKAIGKAKKAVNMVPTKPRYNSAEWWRTVNGN